MKYIKNFGWLLVFVCAINRVQAQAVNWANLKDNKRHMINLRTGIEFGFIYGIDYNYQVKKAPVPILLAVGYSAPAGGDLLDDFRSTVGMRSNLFRSGDFRFNVRIEGVFRRYENDLVRMVNFGSDLAGTIGYYKKRWFVAGEIGFDKAIVSHLKHKPAYKSQYASVQDGWFEPTAGGNFYYGIQAGFSWKQQDIYLRAGRMLEQDFVSSPLIPIYGQLGCNIRF